jgi:hypothetical protein
MKRIVMRGQHPFSTEPKLIIVARLIPSKGLERVEELPLRVRHRDTFG